MAPQQTDRGRHDPNLCRETTLADNRTDCNFAHGIACDGGENGIGRALERQNAGWQSRHRDGDQIDIHKPDNNCAGDCAFRPKTFPDRPTKHDNNAER